MRTYSIYGITFSSSFPFLSPLPLTSREPELQIYEDHGVLDPQDAPHVEMLPEECWHPVNIQAAYRLPGGDLLQYPGGDQIMVEDRALRYLYAGRERTRLDVVDVRLLNSGLAWWLLRRGHIPLHAAAIVTDGEAILLMAGSGTGKSSLTCSLVAAGHPLLCDDFVAIHLGPHSQIMASSAYPQMRLWPVSIERLIGSDTDYPQVAFDHYKRRVHVGEPWGTFAEGNFPVSRIYLLDRLESEEGTINAHRIEGHQAFMSLTSSIFTSASFPVADFQAVWPVIQQMAESVPLYQLSYPSGWHWLPDVRQSVLAG
jgi:hypothetical protein